MTNCNCFVLADPSYSSCCIDTVSALHVSASLIIFIGKSCRSFLALPLEVLYIPSHLRRECTYEGVMEQISQTYPNYTIEDHIIVIDDHICISSLNPCAEIIHTQSWSDFCREHTSLGMKSRTLIYIGESSELLTNAYMYFRGQNMIHISLDHQTVKKIDHHSVNRIVSRR